MRNFKETNKDGSSQLINFLRETYMNFVECNFIARCHSVQLIFDLNEGRFIKLTDSFGLPSLLSISQQRLLLPPITLDTELNLLKKFFTKQVDNFDLLNIFTQDPISSGYDELIKLGRLSKFQAYRTNFYHQIFDMWVFNNRKVLLPLN